MILALAIFCYFLTGFIIAFGVYIYRRVLILRGIEPYRISVNVEMSIVLSAVGLWPLVLPGFIIALILKTLHNSANRIAKNYV